ncbi:FCD domain-containing protein [Streptomyces sp. NPDC008125]|uniref:GntR family transcriptional regulator n=1 Tax=Streptomyces sp. NPDC008125 TaxID=3364811 RepID=UPI0036EF36D6
MEQGGTREDALAFAYPERVGTGTGAGAGASGGSGAAGAGPAPRVPAQAGRGKERGEHIHGEAAAPPPVRRHSVRGQILDALRDALAAGDLVPGRVYSAPALGASFGVSATPVREAMQRLAAEGAVEVVPNRGFRVVERGPRELAELAEVRALIEAPVVLRLARTVPACRWETLRPLAEATVAAAATGDRSAYAESDRAFHRTLLAFAGNAQLVTLADDLHRRCPGPLPGTAPGRPTGLRADAAQHTALLDALIERDTTAVRALVAEHYRSPADA